MTSVKTLSFVDMYRFFGSVFIVNSFDYESCFIVFLTSMKIRKLWERKRTRNWEKRGSSLVRQSGLAKSMVMASQISTALAAPIVIGFLVGNYGEQQQWWEKMGETFAVFIGIFIGILCMIAMIRHLLGEKT